VCYQPFTVSSVVISTCAPGREVRSGLTEIAALALVLASLVTVLILPGLQRKPLPLVGS